MSIKAVFKAKYAQIDDWQQENDAASNYEHIFWGLCSLQS